MTNEQIAMILATVVVTLIIIYWLCDLAYRFVTDTPTDKEIWIGWSWPESDNSYYDPILRRELNKSCWPKAIFTFLFLSLAGGALFGFVLFLVLLFIISVPLVPISLALVCGLLWAVRGLIRLKKDIAAHKADKDAHK